MAFFDERNAISGKLAKAYATINGQTHELFYAQSLEATIEKNKTDVPILGKTNVAQKASGWSGSGTLTIYYSTTLFRDLMLTYVKTGKDFYFDLQVVNEDPTSNIGKQTIVLKRCNLDNITVAAFDATSDDPLTEELSFTFSDFDVLDRFTPAN